ncbi:hypothetical protein EOPP23_20400 [Endozoicomonas sp. OPT23]|uniref:hypothetical protein n=1 Tax=Endozoicomonas sp. OPT23 TaxID=2072845 RepID=UPI00129ACC12|nr:hypothetical protein [Endozoicomonas sp. OPT23]MRI35323.1 hypothetical protein [Endozoicomonas sp. OPT23]
MLRIILTSAAIALASFNIHASDKLQEKLLQHTLADDPIRTVVHQHHLADEAQLLVNAARRGLWEHPLFNTEVSFNLVLYAYQNELIDRHEFLEIQDWLHIKSDFKTASSHFTSAPQTVPTLKITRYRPDQLEQSEEYQKIKSHLPKEFQVKGRGPFSKKLGHWLTFVTLDDSYKDFFADLKSSIKQCAESVTSQKCVEKKSGFEGYKILYFFGVMSLALPELHFYHDNILVFGSINRFLEKLPNLTSKPDFLPVYGSMDWDALIQHRLNGDNAGSIYHPECTSNFFTPHQTYPGTALTLRHDLFHTKVINTIPLNQRKAFHILHKIQASAGAQALKVINNQSEQLLPLSDQDVLEDRNELTRYKSKLIYELEQTPFGDMGYSYDLCDRAFPDVGLAEQIIMSFDAVTDDSAVQDSPPFIQSYLKDILSALQDKQALLQEYNVNVQEVINVIQHRFYKQHWATPALTDYDACTEKEYWKKKVYNNQ